MNDRCVTEAFALQEIRSKLEFWTGTHLSIPVIRMVVQSSSLLAEVLELGFLENERREEAIELLSEKLGLISSTVGTNHERERLQASHDELLTMVKG